MSWLERVTSLSMDQNQTTTKPEAANKETRVCTRCIMDTSAQDVTFNDLGHCNFCEEYDVRYLSSKNSLRPRTGVSSGEFIKRVKADGKGKKYDCIVGVSGGADSSYALYLAKLNGLRPLAVHMDNGWNSELAVHNIRNLVERLDVDLYTHVIDWQEYKALMRAFFESDVIDVELLYDNAMLAVNYHAARKYNVRWILAGTNAATEGMRIPKNWLWFKRDKKNITSIAERHKIRLKTFPLFGTLDFVYNEFVRNVKWVSFLDFFDYKKEKCVDFLREHFDYKPYPYKHYESVFTRFYQGFILPNKFGVDKRRVHLSSLIMSGQISREQAVAMISNPPYPSASALEADIEYFLKKLGWTRNDLDNYISRKERSHSEYGSEKEFWDFCESIYRRLGGSARVGTLRR